MKNIRTRLLAVALALPLVVAACSDSGNPVETRARRAVTVVGSDTTVVFTTNGGPGDTAPDSTKKCDSGGAMGSGNIYC